MVVRDIVDLLVQEYVAYQASCSWEGSHEKSTNKINSADRDRWLNRLQDMFSLYF